ncbi:MAG: hypothetical protein D6809_00360, partial [Gammaproteobacteria bacterium]
MSGEQETPERPAARAATGSRAASGTESGAESGAGPAAWDGVPVLVRALEPPPPGLRGEEAVPVLDPRQALAPPPRPVGGAEDPAAQAARLRRELAAGLRG